MYSRIQKSHNRAQLIQLVQLVRREKRRQDSEDLQGIQGLGVKGLGFRETSGFGSRVEGLEFRVGATKIMDTLGRSLQYQYFRKPPCKAKAWSLGWDFIGFRLIRENFILNLKPCGDSQKEQGLRFIVPLK